MYDATWIVYHQSCNLLRQSKTKQIRSGVITQTPLSFYSYGAQSSTNLHFNLQLISRFYQIRHMMPCRNIHPCPPRLGTCLSILLSLKNLRRLSRVLVQNNELGKKPLDHRCLYLKLQIYLASCASDSTLSYRKVSCKFAPRTPQERTLNPILKQRDPSI